MKLRVGSYNVKDFIAPGQGNGIRQPKSKTELKALAETLKDADCDVVCLQEIGSKALLEKFVKERLDGAYQHIVFVPGNDKSGVSLAMISKYPFTKVVSHRNDRVPRGDGNGFTHFTRDFLRADVQVGDQTVTVYNTHGKARMGERSTAYQREDECWAGRDIIMREMAPYPKRLYVVTGDFNDEANDKSVRALAEGDGRGPRLKDSLEGKSRAERITFEGDRNSHQFDHILYPVAQQARFRGSQVHNRAPGAKIASDHYLVTADFEIPDSG